MFTIIIQEKGGEQRRMVFNKPEVTIGRVQGNDIVLPKGNVSKRHARIVLKDGKFIIVDLKSTNGTYVNGRKITSPLVVKDSDKIYIGDFIVGVDEAAAEGDGPSETTTSPPGSDRPIDPRPPAPTTASPQPMGGMPGMGMGGGMGGMGGMGGPPEPPPPAAPPAPSMPPPMGARGPGGGPPRPPGGPPRDLGGPPRDMDGPMGGGPMGGGPMGGGPMGGGPMGGPMGGGPMGGPMGGGPMGGPPREPPGPRGLGGPPREPPGPSRDMPPIAPPPANEARTRPPVRGAGGTMPPPMAPIPSPTSAPPPPDPHFPPPAAMPPPGPMGGAPMGNPMAMAPPVAPPTAAPMPVAVAAPSIAAAPQGTPAQVVPLQKDKSARTVSAVGTQPSKKITGRPLAPAAKRGVQLEPLDSKIVKMLDLQANILERLRAKLDLDRVPLERLHEDELWQRAEKATIDLVETLETSGELPKYIDQEALIKGTLNEALALGPLEDLFQDDSIDEILIDRRDRVVVGKGGQLRGSGKAFSSDEMLERVVKRLVFEAGSVIDESHPVVDLRMRDGTRVTAAVAPVAARGACLVLKKPPASTPTLADLVSQGVLSNGMAEFLTTCITARRNVLVCGGPGSGKTTLVGALAGAAPAGERIVSVEDVAELAIGRDEWIQLETRPTNGKGNDVDLGALLDTAMRLMPDRLVVGDVRGREAMPLVNALNSSVDGAIVGMSGEGTSAALNRLATLARATSALGADWTAIRELVGTAFEIVVHVTRGTDGTIKVSSIEELSGVSDVAFETEQVFCHKDGGFAASGKVPRFYSELGADQAVFR
ncbi:MAG TPA: ATPase, T2SS/T4P/T4SS family [Kofleriaceae bacterium]|nr:ATPase, T2SS/T4P/T4SS family [Kofleriaceae bacterium]